MERCFTLPPGDARLATTGPAERNLKLIREALGVDVSARDQTLRIVGEPQAVALAAGVVQRLQEAAQAGRTLGKAQLLEALSSAALPGPPTAAAILDAETAAGVAADTSPAAPTLAADGALDVYLPGRRVRAKTAGQLAYLKAIHDHDLTFCLGPAGTGKTYLAVAAAVNMLKRGAVRKLVLVRPAVEAGEKLGFLPGTMQDKVNPYLRPLLDALHDMMEFDHIERFMSHDLIEIVPLAFMRGRTLNDALIILDEAQNTTQSQMLMFLTRLGHGGKMVVTGDASQIDLDDPRDSGLIDAFKRLKRVPGIGRCTLDAHDIVRHPLVQRVVAAYGPDER